MPNFTIDNAHSLLRETIENKLRHAGYQRTCDLRDDYLTILTGKGWPRFVPRFTLRCDTDEHLQQIALTHQNLSSTSSLLEKKFGQISRVQDIKKGLNFEGTSNRDQTDLLDVLNDFGGEGSAQRGSLDDYLTLMYDRTALYDPNAFILYDFTEFNANAGQRARPYGVLFTCPNVLNFRYTRGDLDYLLVRIAVEYKDPTGIKKVAFDYLCFIGPQTIRYYEEAEGRLDMPTNYIIWKGESSDVSYRMVAFTPGVAAVPAVRLGYVPDPETGNTTMVSPAFHAAMDLFKELIDLKSTNDIITKKHGYPQQFKQAPPCPGEVVTGTTFRSICDQGINKDTGMTCKQCGGSGHLVHKSEQDTITMDLANEPADWADLSKLVYTVQPQLETIKAFDEKIENKKAEIVLTVFSVDQQVKVQAPADTATKFMVSREDQNNTLLPFADQKSFVYKDSVRHISALMNISGQVLPLYEFARDLKLTSITDLYADLKAARDAGSTWEEIAQIQDDINRKRYEADPVALKRYFIKKQHIPYIALTFDQVLQVESERLTPKDMVVRYVSSDIIFGELEIEHPNFYDLPYLERETLVTDKTTAIMDKLPQSVDFSASIRKLNSADPQLQVA